MNHTSPQRRLAAVLPVLSCLAALGLSAGCNFFRSADSRVAQAEKQMTQGNYNAAMIDLKSVLEDQPEHRGARVALARLSLVLGDVEAAQKELQWALKLGVDRNSLLELQSRIGLARNQFAEVAATLEKDRTLSPARRATLLAAAQIGLKDYESAQRHLDEALRLAPRDADALLQQAYLLGVHRRFDEALKSADAAFAQNPKLSQAGLLRSRLLVQLQRYPEAIGVLSKLPDTARLTAAEEFERLGTLCELQLLTRDVPGATATVKQLEARYGGTPPTRYLRARVALVGKDFRTAIAELQQAARMAPDYVPVQLLLGRALLAQGNLEQAQVGVERLLSQHPESIEARQLLAQVQLSRGQPQLAQHTLIEGGEGVQNAQVDLLMGTALLQSGSTDAGFERLERSLAAQPGNRLLRLQLAKTYISKGQRDKALALLEAVPPAQRDAQTQQLIVLADVAGKSSAEALKTLHELARQNKNDSQVLAIVGALTSTAGDRQAARQYLDASIALDSKNVAALLSRVWLELRASQLDAAEKDLKAVLRVEPKHQGAHIGLAGIAWQRGQHPEARQWLEKAIVADPSTVDARLQLARLALADKDVPRAQSLLEQAIVVGNRRPVVLNAAGEVLLSAGRYEDALTRFSAAVEGGFPNAKLNVARAQLALGRSEEARGTLEAVLAADPKALAAVVMLMGLDARQGRNEEAQRRLAKLRKAGMPAATLDQLQKHLAEVTQKPAGSAGGNR